MYFMDVIVMRGCGKQAVQANKFIVQFKTNS